MSHAWIQTRGDPTWAMRSADGYYRIAHHGPPTVGYQAFHVEALWAKPCLIGRGETIEAAKIICEEHRARAAA